MRKEKRKYVARPGIEPRTSDLRVRCPTDCATRPGALHTVEHVVQSKSEKKKQKKTYFVCVGGRGGGAATALMAQSRQRGHNELGPTEKKLCVRLFFVLMLSVALKGRIGPILSGFFVFFPNCLLVCST